MRGALLVALAAAALAGCFSPLKSLERRSAIEQELTSAALKQGVASLDLDAVDRARRYALRIAAPADADTVLIRARVESRLARDGIRLAPDAEASSDTEAPTLRVTIPFSGVDLEATLWGIPLIVPGLPLALGDISLYRSTTITGRARVELSLWEGSDAAPQEISATEAARHYQNFSVFTFIGPFRRSDLEEGPLPGDEP